MFPIGHINNMHLHIGWQPTHPNTLLQTGLLDPTDGPVGLAY